MVNNLSSGNKMHNSRCILSIHLFTFHLTFLDLFSLEELVNFHWLAYLLDRTSSTNSHYLKQFWSKSLDRFQPLLFKLWLILNQFFFTLLQILSQNSLARAPIHACLFSNLVDGKKRSLMIF